MFTLAICRAIISIVINYIPYVRCPKFAQINCISFCAFFVSPELHNKLVIFTRITAPKKILEGEEKQEAEEKEH